jgi:iron(II)-dependent oxidoreductase
VGPETQHRPRTDVAGELGRARRKTLALLEQVPEEELTRQISPLMSPLVWDLAHIGWFEELWLLRRLGGLEATHERFDDLYDAFSHGRAERAGLPLLEPRRAFEYVQEVRERTLDLLDEIDGDESDDPLLADGFVFGLVVQHELQHIETMLQTLSLSDRPIAGLGPAGGIDAEPGDVTVPAGTFTMGAEGEPWAYDNEREPHDVALRAYTIDRLPTANAAFIDFVEDGYADPRYWPEAGNRWRAQQRAAHPLHWRRSGSGWLRTRFGRTEALDPAVPVEHISWFEAEAFARWSGRRLPTEQEWECAMKLGALEGTGAVWEWTASHFLPYPGFSAFPYAEYSEVFFGDAYRVLRGGSWATDRLVARPTFRNWDYPQRRQIFAGVRLAADA